MVSSYLYPNLEEHASYVWLGQAGQAGPAGDVTANQLPYWRKCPKGRNQNHKMMMVTIWMSQPRLKDSGDGTSSALPVLSPAKPGRAQSRCLFG